MSAPPSKSFVDHYQVLEIDHRATTETVQAAYERLSRRYAPGADTADPEKFAAVNASFDVLIDPTLRQAFDQVRGGEGESMMEFPVEEFVAGLGDDSAQRVGLLSLLYYRRKYTPVAPGVALRQAESIFNTSMDELSFNVWYLKQKGFITTDDKSKLQITVSGIEYVEKAAPTVELLRPALRPLELRKKMEADQAARQAQAEAGAKEKRDQASQPAAPPARPGQGKSPQPDPGSLRSLGSVLDKSRSQNTAPPPPAPPSTRPPAAKPEQAAPAPSRRIDLTPKFQR